MPVVSFTVRRLVPALTVACVLLPAFAVHARPTAGQGAPVSDNQPAPVSLLRPETPLYTATLASRLAAASNDPGLASEAMLRAAGDGEGGYLVRARAVSAAMDSGDFATAGQIAGALSADQRAGKVLIASAAAPWFAGNWAAVAGLFESAVLAGPERLVGQTMLAWSKYAIGQEDQALQIASRGTGVAAHDIANLATRALMLDQSGNRRDALAAYASVWNLGLRQPQVGERYAVLLVQAREQAKANGVIDELMENATDRSVLEALKQGRVPRDRARLSLDRARTASLSTMALSLLVADEITWPAELAIRSGSDQSALRLLLAGHYASKDRNELAAASLRGIPATATQFPVAVGILAEMLADTDIPAARQELTLALATRPDSPELLLAAAFVETKSKNYSTAIERYTAVIDGASAGRVAATPADLARARISRGILFDSSSKLDEAEADYRAALALAPDNPSMMNGLGYFLADRSRNLDEATTLLQRAVAAEPRNGSIVDSLGWALFRQGRYEQAVGLLERAMALEPRQSVIADHLGDAYWRTGRLVEARMEWRKAITLTKPGELGEPDIAMIEAKIRDGLPPRVPAAGTASR